jgi:hypothetical protein
VILQDAIELFQDKKYKKAYKEFSKYLNQSQDKNSQVHKYLYLSLKYIGQDFSEELRTYINSLFEEKKYEDLIELIENNFSKLRNNELVIYIKSLFNSGNINKAQEEYLNALKQNLEQKNYIAIEELLNLEKEIIKYNPKVELIKLMMWVELQDYKSIIETFEKIDNAIQQNWKIFRNEKIDTEEFKKKYLEIIEPLKNENVEIYKLYYKNLIRMGQRLELQEALEYLIINIDNPVEQSFLSESLEEQDNILLRDYVLSQEIEDKKLLHESFQVKIKKPTKIIHDEYKESESFNLHFDRAQEPVELLELESYKSSQAEKDLIKQIKKNEEIQENAEQYIQIFIENNFLYACLEIAKYIEDIGLKNYLYCRNTF